MAKMRPFLACLILLFIGFSAQAQFYTTGSESASIRFNSIKDSRLELIYPEGHDSLALDWKQTLLKYVPPTSVRLPVVLHTSLSTSNGMVAYPPLRMDLYTSPDMYNPVAVPWRDHLIIHESRHVEQINFGFRRPFRWMGVLTGGISEALVSALYNEQAFMEGDAVLSETLLTGSGRGRSADFLEYYKVCFADSLKRNWYRWRYGSQKYYTPDYYRAGYVAMSGIRALYSQSDFLGYMYQRTAERKGFSTLSGTVKSVSGKNLKHTFTEICDSLSAFWEQDHLRRLEKGYTPSRQISPDPKYYTDYHSLTLSHQGSSFLALRSSLTRPSELVQLSAGGASRPLMPFNSESSTLETDPSSGIVYWSEPRPDPRWEYRSWSEIHYLTPDNKRHALTRRSRLFNPRPDGMGQLCAVELPTTGGSNAVLISAEDGAVLASYPSRPGCTWIECVRTADSLMYASELGEDGFSIVRLSDNSRLIEPQKVKIKQLRVLEGSLLSFVSDLDGTDEFYVLDPESRTLTRLTSTRFGSSDHIFISDTLYYTSLHPHGRLLHHVPADSLKYEKLPFVRTAVYPFVSQSSEPEPAQPQQEGSPDAEVSPYGRLAHLIKLHSWLPFYLDYDAIDNLSGLSITSSLGLGASLFFQSSLSDSYGSIAYNARSVYGGWRHSAHLKYTYTGLYPVIETSFNVNSRQAQALVLGPDAKGNLQLSSGLSSAPLLNGNIKLYVPLNFSSGGLSRGVIPSVNLQFTNDSFRDDTRGGESHNMAHLNAGVRAYVMQRIPSSRIYPRWGAGAELLCALRPFAANYISPLMLAQVYAYTPGFGECDGFRFKALGEFAFDGPLLREAYASVAPRGFDSSVSNFLSRYGSKLRLSLDWAIPFAPLDCSLLGPVAYIRNLELTPHADWTLLSRSGESSGLWSLGADFCVKLGNFLWLPFATRLGVSYNYKGGSLYPELQSLGYDSSLHNYGILLSMEF